MISRVIASNNRMNAIGHSSFAAGEGEQACSPLQQQYFPSDGPQPGSIRLLLFQPIIQNHTGDRSQNLDRDFTSIIQISGFD